MILAAGFSPCWQRVQLFDGWTRDRVNRAKETLTGGSGKAVNVAIGLAHLHEPHEPAARLLSTCGGIVGQQLRQDCERLGIMGRWIETAAETRTCTTLIDHTDGSATELVEETAPLTTAEWERIREAVAEEVNAATIIVLSGSLPQGTPTNTYADLLAGFSGRILLDARGPELSAALEREPTLVKPNREELARTVGRELRSDAEVRTAADELHQRGAEWVLVTDGPNPAWLSSREVRYRVEPLTGPVVNPIGCGDSLTAAIAWRLAAGDEMPEAVRAGIAAATVNMADLRPARLDRSRVESLAHTVRIQRITD